MDAFSLQESYAYGNRSMPSTCVAWLLCRCCFTICCCNFLGYGRNQSPAALSLFRGDMVVARGMSSLEPGGQRKALQVRNQQGA